MSDLLVEATRQQMEENGELEFIRQHRIAAGQIADDEAATPAEEADTEETEEVEDSAEEEIPTDVGIEPEEESEEDDDVVYLDLDPATQTLLDTKYGGDINKALVALTESQSLIGRQGNELGELRKELQEQLQGLRGEIVRSQPYPEWPEEYDDPAEAGARFRDIAETAFAREDVDMFGSAVDAWVDLDPVAAQTYRDLKILQLQTSLQRAPVAAPQGPSPEETVAAGVRAVQAKYPQMETPEFKAAMDAELTKFPALKELLWGSLPGTTAEQRVAALEETVSRIASRQLAETEETARRRVAVRRSEEARQARAEAKVASGESARVAEVEPEKNVVSLGETGMVLDLDRVAALSGETITLGKGRG